MVVEQVVEPDEVRLEIRQRLEVMHVVLESASVERNPVVRSERKRVTAVLVDAQEVQEDHEGPGGQRVAAQDPRCHRPEQPHADQLPRMKVLHHPAVDRVVGVVDGMNVTVEEAIVMMDDVPGVEHGVHDDQSGVMVPDELDDPGRQRRQTGFRRPDALRDGNRKYVEHLVPTGERYRLARHFPGNGDIRLDLATADPVPVSSPVIEERVGN